ncbi:hypothetical protein PWT90_08400 [Aphanocladium album]|nr:hypothetical protein PWT90_08400 [Aphanocladium album]
MLGPFDGRRKRSRCQRCAAGHLKCSGTNPCSNCTRKGMPCSYVAANKDNVPIIIVGASSRSKPGSSVALVVSRQRTAAAAAAPRASPAMDDERYFYYFDVFAQRNNFSGKNRLFTDDVKQMGELQTVPYFLNSVRALGAIQATKLSGSGNTYASYALYSQAVVGLRKSLDEQQETMSDSKRTALLWTTLFLGMFELMSDMTGMGWIQHMVHGTAKGLAASGPSICQTAAGARMFQQAKMFEVCRTIVFNDRSFLTRPEWMKASQALWSHESFANEWQPLDSLVDIMLLCPDLRHRANKFCQAEDDNPSPGVPEEARDIADTGLELRDALNAWHEKYLADDDDDDGSSPSSPTGQPPVDTAGDECALLTRLFWTAISVYLSGEFDYEMHHWERFGLAVPTLDQPTVERHVGTILALTEHALARSSLSPLLFLFPLRIAGARSARMGRIQRERVLRNMTAVAERFDAAYAIREGLVDAWKFWGIKDD